MTVRYELEYERFLPRTLDVTIINDDPVKTEHAALVRVAPDDSDGARAVLDRMCRNPSYDYEVCVRLKGDFDPRADIHLTLDLGDLGFSRVSHTIIFRPLLEEDRTFSLDVAVPKDPTIEWTLNLTRVNTIESVYGNVRKIYVSDHLFALLDHALDDCPVRTVCPAGDVGLDDLIQYEGDETELEIGDPEKMHWY